MICLGGSEAFRLRWINGRIEREQLPELPRGTFLSSLDRLVRFCLTDPGELRII